MKNQTFFTVDEVGIMLRKHRVTIQKMAINKTIPAFKIGREWRIDKEELYEWIEKQKVKAI